VLSFPLPLFHSLLSSFLLFSLLPSSLFFSSVLSPLYSLTSAGEEVPDDEGELLAGGGEADRPNSKLSDEIAEEEAKEEGGEEAAGEEPGGAEPVLVRRRTASALLKGKEGDDNERVEKKEEG
jgi:hypothetical protein